MGESEKVSNPRNLTDVMFSKVKSQTAPRANEQTWDLKKNIL